MLFLGLEFLLNGRVSLVFEVDCRLVVDLEISTFLANFVASCAKFFFTIFFKLMLIAGTLS